MFLISRRFCTALVRSALAYFRARRLGRLFRHRFPRGLRPIAGLLKRMNSAFMWHPLSRKNVARGQERDGMSCENVSGVCPTEFSKDGGASLILASEGFRVA